MVTRRVVVALLLVQLTAFAVSAQQSAEYGRAASGEMVMTPKGSAPFSGSLEVSMSTGNDFFGRGSFPAYAVTAGGTLVNDRLWFFGSAVRQEVPVSRFETLDLPETATSGAVAAQAHGQIAGSHAFSAFVEAARRPELQVAASSASTFEDVLPSSFLSLRYTGVVSSDLMFSGSLTRSSRIRTITTPR